MKHMEACKRGLPLLQDLGGSGDVCVCVCVCLVPGVGVRWCVCGHVCDGACNAPRMAAAASSTSNPPECRIHEGTPRSQQLRNQRKQPDDLRHSWTPKDHPPASARTLTLT